MLRISDGNLKNLFSFVEHLANVEGREKRLVK